MKGPSSVPTANLHYIHPTSTVFHEKIWLTITVNWGGNCANQTTRYGLNSPDMFQNQGLYIFLLHCAVPSVWSAWTPQMRQSADRKAANDRSLLSKRFRCCVTISTHYFMTGIVNDPESSIVSFVPRIQYTEYGWRRWEEKNHIASRVEHSFDRIRRKHEDQWLLALAPSWGIPGRNQRDTRDVSFCLRSYWYPLCAGLSMFCCWNGNKITPRYAVSGTHTQYICCVADTIRDGGISQRRAALEQVSAPAKPIVGLVHRVYGVWILQRTVSGSIGWKINKGLVRNEWIKPAAMCHRTFSGGYCEVSNPELTCLSTEHWLRLWFPTAFLGINLFWSLK